MLLARLSSPLLVFIVPSHYPEYDSSMRMGIPFLKKEARALGRSLVLGAIEP